MTTKEAGLISWFIQKYFAKPADKVDDAKKLEEAKKKEEEAALAKALTASLPTELPTAVKVSYVQGFLDKLAETQFLSDKERSAQKQRLKNSGEDAGKGLQLADLIASNNNTVTGVDKSLGISYDYGIKEAGLLEQVGKYSTPIAERLSRFLARVRQAPEDTADLLEAIKGKDVGTLPEIDEIYRDIGKKTLYTGAVGTAGALGIKGLMELQDTEADA
jgi:hypothetical protein